MPIVSALETSSGQKVTANDSEPPIINIWRMLADFELCDFNEIYRINAHNRKVPPCSASQKWHFTKDWKSFICK
ncbi:hypothetical protein AI2760V1_4741 (plasmid) [Enterobacter cloacae]|nr:hypothetical protein AI2760V1_4741 [Enterobacter cloacae]CAH4023922.1 hypothetical protein AI2760V1_4741 [Enterobacter cloacae]